MSTQDRAMLLRTLFDDDAQVRSRRAAAERLGAHDEEDVLDALLELARAENVDRSVARAVGSSIAQILLRRGEVHRAPLADFTGPAYRGFDETVSCHQRAGTN